MSAKSETSQLRLAGSALTWPLGKVVCVGRNYADHAKELNNPVPSAPILFIKPASAVVPFAGEIGLPQAKGECHHELELALLIGKTLTAVTPAEAVNGIAGYGLALDLTLRELQTQLKAKGHPWEVAKSFDGACPLSEFITTSELKEPQQAQLQLLVNDQLRQDGNTRDMLTPIPALVSYISEHFTLRPGDIVLTGTPAGVGPLVDGDLLEARLNGQQMATARVNRS